MSLDDVQGNVLRGYGHDHAHFVFAKITDLGRARTWLEERAPHVTFHEHGKQPHTFNIAFTYRGLRALGVPEDRLGGLEAFAKGMEGRAPVIGDAGPCAPAHWQQGLRGADLLIVLTAKEENALKERRAELDEHLDERDSGLRTSHPQPAATLPGAREHFGFSDGFSQPAVKGVETGPRDGEGVLVKHPLWRTKSWRELAIGEFILGYSDEGGLNSPAPTGPLGQDATFMVVRKLEQDVLAFRAYVRQQADRHGQEPEWIAAKMVGRWQNGSPLATHPHAPGPPADRRRAHINRFHYEKDQDGVACPLGAHVRRTNPRDALGWEGKLTKRHRILRRGISYGDALPTDATGPDGRERGLMFVCYQASIERQFEFIQQQWVNDGNVFGLAGDRDPIMAGPAADGAGAEMLIQGRPPVFLSSLPRFVSTRGGDYFLLPGKLGLQALASGSW